MNQLQAGAPSQDDVASQVVNGSPRELSYGELLQIANQLHQDGDLAKAETLYRLVLETHPNNADALQFLGLIAADMNQVDAGIDLIERAISQRPDDHRIHNNHGNLLRRAGRLQDAAAAFKRACEIDENYTNALYNLGVTLRELRRPADAELALKKAIEIDPRNADAHYELGLAFSSLQRNLEAQIAYRVTLDIDPTHERARNKIGDIISALGAFDAAITEYETVLETNPENIDVLNGLGNALKRQGHFGEALDRLNTAFDLNNINTETLHNLATVYQSIGDNEKASNYHEHLLDMAPTAEFSEKSFLFLLLNRPGIDPKKRFDIHRVLRGRHDRPEVRDKKFPGRSNDPDRRLRIGYLSSDFRTHVIALNMLPVIYNHDHSKFDIRLYYHFKGEDSVTKACREFSDEMTIIGDETNAEIAEMIERDEIDILVTLAGRFDENRPLVSTFRPAPVQVSFHDCATSGLEAMDYWLTDEILHPLDTKELFTEELYRLPIYYQYVIQDGLPDPGPPPALRNGYITFGCFNKPEKINEEVVSLWAKVLLAVPNSRILFKYFNHYHEPFMRERMTQMFAGHGIDEDRLNFMARADIRTDHLANYHDVDISLDPFPFNGATTTFEAITMGVPVVSLMGENFVDRVAGSITTHAGYPELTTTSTQAYVEKASELAADLDHLAELRRSMRESVARSPLCDNARYAGIVEDAYRDMWQRWCKEHADS